MRKNKKIYRNLLIVVVSIYVVITLVNQQKVLNTYNKNQKELSKQIEERNEYKQELINTRENIDSLEYIEQVAREKLDMYLPNERVYEDKGM